MGPTGNQGKPGGGWGHTLVDPLPIITFSMNTDGYYQITGSFGKVFNLVNWQFCGKLPNLKSANIISITLYGSTHNRQI